MSGPVSGLPGLGICCSSLFPFLTMTGALAEQNVEVCLVSVIYKGWMIDDE